MRTIALAAVLASGLLRAQAPDASQPEIDAAILSADAAKNPEALEQQAADFEGRHRYGSAEKLLTAALSLRGKISGDHSVEYGLCLLRLGDIEHKLIRTKESADYYSRAVQLLPGRAETARAFLYLGITAVDAKDFTLAAQHFQRARSLDISLTGPVLTWTAVMYERQDQPEQAEAKYKAALACEAGSFDTEETLALYRRFLEGQGRGAEAQALQASASGIHVARSSQPSRPELMRSAPFAYHAGSDVTEPRVVSKVDPSYSEEARLAKVSGTVQLEAIVGADGQPRDIKVLKNAGFGLDECAIEAVSKWRFKPGKKDGVAVPVYVKVEMNFRL